MSPYLTGAFVALAAVAVGLAAVHATGYVRRKLAIMKGWDEMRLFKPDSRELYPRWIYKELRAYVEQEGDNWVVSLVDLDARSTVTYAFENRKEAMECFRAIKRAYAGEV